MNGLGPSSLNISRSFLHCWMPPPMRKFLRCSQFIGRASSRMNWSAAYAKQHPIEYLDIGRVAAQREDIIILRIRGLGRISIARWAPRKTPAGFRIYKALAPGCWFNKVSRPEYETAIRRSAWTPRRRADVGRTAYPRGWQRASLALLGTSAVHRDELVSSTLGGDSGSSRPSASRSPNSYGNPTCP